MNSITTDAIAFLMLKAATVISLERAETMLVQAENIHREKHDLYFQRGDKQNIADCYVAAVNRIENGVAYEDLDELSVSVRRSLTKAHERYSDWTDSRIRNLPKTPNNLSPVGAKQEEIYDYIHQTLIGMER